MTVLQKPHSVDFSVQYKLALDLREDAIIVDLFAGGGGASTGLEMGLGKQVSIAVNHDPAAISMHTANHPHAAHFQTDVWGVDPLEHTDGKQVGWLHASPDCRHHSQASAGQPRKKEIRDLSWVTVKWAGKLHKQGRAPWVCSLENVRFMLNWGPLVAKRDKATGRVIRADGTVANPGEVVPRHEQFLVPDTGALAGNRRRRFKQRSKYARHGSPVSRTWKHFVEALRGMGYQVQWWIARNCDYGDPTTRERLYMVATADGFAPVKPEPTHAAVQMKKVRPYRTAADCIDWSDLGVSLRDKRPLAEATNRRIAAGIGKEVFNRYTPFLVPPTAGEPVQASRATGTLVQTGYGERKGQAPRAPGLKKPLGTVVAGGGKHARATAFLAQANGGYNVIHSRPVDSPISAVTRTGSQQQLVAVNLVTLRKGCAPPAADTPLGTQTGRSHHGVVACDLVHLCGADGGADADRNQAAVNTALAEATLSDEQIEGALWVANFLMRYRSQHCDWPAFRTPSSGSTVDLLAMVTVWIDGEPYIITDIRFRMLRPRELYRAQGFPDSYIITHGHDGREFTIKQQVHMCGNSVSPGTMAAIAKANDPWKQRMRSALAA